MLCTHPDLPDATADLICPAAHPGWVPAPSDPDDQPTDTPTDSEEE